MVRIQHFLHCSLGLIPGPETAIPHQAIACCGGKKKKKKKKADLPHWQTTCINPEKTHPQKRFETFKESLAGLTDGGLCLYKNSL